MLRPEHAILANVRGAIAPDGKLILAEPVIVPGPAPHPSKLIDIEMLIFVGGKERREDQWRQLLNDSGFNLARVIETRSPLCLIEAVAV